MEKVKHKKLSKLDANSVHFINKKVTIYEIIQEAIKNVSVLYLILCKKFQI
jgi:hypothetical protein